MMFYPCIENKVTGRISQKVSDKPMTKEQAEQFLKRHYWSKCVRCEAIPQPITHPYFN